MAHALSAGSPFSLVLTQPTDAKGRADDEMERMVR